MVPDCLATTFSADPSFELYFGQTPLGEVKTLPVDISLWTHSHVDAGVYSDYCGELDFRIENDSSGGAISRVGSDITLSPIATGVFTFDFVVFLTLHPGVKLNTPVGFIVGSYDCPIRTICAGDDSPSCDEAHTEQVDFLYG